MRWDRNYGQVKHGMNRTPTYGAWNNMLQRRKKGVTVCFKWLKFEGFFEDMGVRPDGHSLARIDETRGYEPGNCEWRVR